MAHQQSDSLQQMLQAALKFRYDRNWGEFHTPKNLAINLVREVSEALEVCLWRSDEEILQDEQCRQDLAKELADTLHALLVLCNVMDIDLVDVYWSKLEELDQRYPAKEFKNKTTHRFKKRKKHKLQED